jgi:eukaryotic-like serine/threonine-protein kinase
MDVEGYEILAEPRADGRGRYPARQRATGRLVTLELAPRGQSVSPGDLDAARDRLAALALMDHPHLVPVLALGEHDGAAFLVRPHGAAVELSALLAVGPLPPRQAARWVGEVAGAVAYLHEHGVFGPDLGVEDVFVEAGEAMLNASRAGYVKFLHPPLPPAAPEGLVGVPGNLSPEQIRGEGQPDNPRRDVWSLGVLLYHLLTAQTPFPGETALTTILTVLEAEPAAPRVLRPELPADLEAICLNCLRKTPDDRYADVTRLAEALGAFQEGRSAAPVSGPAPTLASRMGRWVRGWWPAAKD